MTTIRRLVLDVLKPLEPSCVELAGKLSAVKGVEAVDIDVREIDRKVETVRLTLEGEWLDFERINATLEKYGAVVHSVDRVTAGNRLTSP